MTIDDRRLTIRIGGLVDVWTYRRRHYPPRRCGGKLFQLVRGSRQKHQRAALLRGELQTARGPHVQSTSIRDDACDRGRARGEIDRPQPRIQIEVHAIDENRLLKEMAVFIRATGVANEGAEVGAARSADPYHRAMGIVQEGLPREMDQNGKGRNEGLAIGD